MVRIVGALDHELCRCWNVDADTNQLLGCAVLGVEGGELMAMFEIAMMGKLPYTVLKDAIFAHPTLAESLNNLFMAMDG